MYSFSERPEIADFCVSNFPQVSKVGIKSDGCHSPSNYGKSILIPIWFQPKRKWYNLKSASTIQLLYMIIKHSSTSPQAN